MSEPIDHALKIARMGWPVFPVHPATKKPLVGGGFKDATIDETVIHQWWGTFAKAMIGVPTGPAIAAFVVDIDAGEDKQTGELFELQALRGNLEKAIGCSLPVT